MCPYTSVLHSHLSSIRDVNSREIAFPGRESQFPGLDRDSRFRLSTYFYLCDRSWIAGRGAKGRSPAGPGAVPGR